MPISAAFCAGSFEAEVFSVAPTSCWFAWLSERPPCDAVFRDVFFDEFEFSFSIHGAEYGDWRIRKMRDADEVLEKRRAAKRRYDNSEKGQAVKRRGYENRKRKEAAAKAREVEEIPKIAGVWYEDDPRAVADGAGVFGFNFLS